MPTFYLDHGAYATNLGATPTWGVPQEGDGTATAAAATAGTASIDLTGITADAGDTIVIAGATLTCVASGAGANQFNAATGATLAANVVSAINAATNTVSTNVARSVSNNTNQLRNVVYARQGGDTNVVEIMFRIGSTSLNHATNSNVAIAQSGLSSSPTIVQFIGGTSGCFGWFDNPVALGVSSSIAWNTYGVFVFPPHVCKSGSSSTYALTIADPVECRNGRTCSYNLASSVTWGRPNTVSTPLWLRVDDGTVWAGDSPSGIFTFRGDNTGGSGPGVSMAAGTAGDQLILEARQKKGFRLALGGTTVSTPGTVAWRQTSSSVSSALFKHIEVYEDNTVTTQFPWNLWGLAPGTSSVNASVEFDACVFSNAVTRGPAAQTAGNSFLIGNASYDSTTSYLFNDCTWRVNYNGVSSPTYGLIHGNNVFGFDTVEINGGRVESFVDGGAAFPGGWPLITGSNWAKNCHVKVHGLAGVKLLDAIAGLQTALAAANTLVRPDARSISVSLPDATRTFRHENTVGICDWLVSSPAYPYLSAALPDGTGWSVRAFWLSAANTVLCGRPFSLQRFVKQYRGATAALTITLKFWVKDALVFTDQNFVVTILYVDSTGAMKSAMVGGGSITAGTGDSWSSTSGYAEPIYKPKKISYSTGAVSVLANTEVVLIASLRGVPSSGVNESMFFDPEFVLA